MEAALPIQRPVRFPSSGNALVPHDFDDIGALVAIGANGSGKSRLGHWIEYNQNSGREVHRISAQRALSFKTNVTQKPIEAARNLVLTGYEAGGQQHKIGRRWKSNPTSHVLNDYDDLLSLVYALERNRDADVIAAIRGGTTHTDNSIPESVLDRIKRIWAELLPHRTLVTTNDAVKAQAPSGTEYDGIDMSDGERVALYLMGECLCAPENSILVIDEPEIHLHKAIQGRLWDQMESERPDCSFVYITHDLDFAAERDYSAQIWVESFDGANWTWADIPLQSDFPPALTLEILGSRKPILFVEGESTSLDKVYRSLFPMHTIIPRGSCFSVIRSVRAMREPGLFNGHTAFGLIDRDRRSQEELDALVGDNVFSCPVAEVENLLCLPEVLNAAAKAIMAPEKAQEAIAFAIKQFQTEIDKHATAFSYKEVHFRLGRFAENKRWTKAEMSADFATHVQGIDPNALYDTEHSRLKGIADSGDYLEILKVFNRKGLANQLADKLGMKSDAYHNWFFGVVESETKTNKQDGILAAIRALLPAIPTA